MKILILGDIMGPSGRKVLIENLSSLIKRKNLDFVIINGENAADDGLGITKEIANNFLNAVSILLQVTIFGTRKM